jgi:hypothetical protein
MSFALLEVLRRHRLTWTAQEAASMQLDANELAAREHLNMAELAMAQGKTGTALRRAWRSVAASPRPQTLWRITKSAIRLVLGRHA